MQNPNNYYFPGRAADEPVLLVIRRHKMALMQKLSLFVLCGVLPVIFSVLLITYTDWLDDRFSIVYLVLVLFAGLYYLYLLLFMYHAWIDYYLDVWVITDRRIIATDQRGLFHRQIAELQLDKIQDVSSDIHGLFPTLFNYGRIHIQTASEQDKFSFEEVPKAEHVARRILQLHQEYIRSAAHGQHAPSVAPSAPPTPPAPTP
ncbi:MAG: PH domain-containing protein [Patescibacteria group bacterium]